MAQYSHTQDAITQWLDVKKDVLGNNTTNGEGGGVRKSNITGELKEVAPAEVITTGTGNEGVEGEIPDYNKPIVREELEQP